jgi:hypothetical protein
MKTALAFIRRRVRLELELLNYIEGSHEMSSPQLDALVQAVANLSAAKDSAIQAIAGHAAVAVDPAALVSLTQQVQAATDALNQVVADHPVPVVS